LAIGFVLQNLFRSIDKQIFILLLLKTFLSATIFIEDKNSTEVDLTKFASYKVLPFGTDVKDVYKTVESFTSISETKAGRNIGEIWVFLSVKNESQDDIEAVLKTVFYKFEYIDFFIFENGKLAKTYHRGIMQNIDGYDFFTRPNAIPLNIQTDSTYEILIAMKSSVFSSYALELLSEKDYIKELLLESIIFVLLIGIIFSAIVYNLSIYINTKLSEFVYYALGGILFLVQIYFQFGFSVWLFQGVPSSVSNIGFFVVTSLIYIPLVLFAQKFFETKLRFRYIHYVLNILLAVFTIFAILFLGAFFYDKLFLLLPVWFFFNSVIFFTFIFLGAKATLKKYPGAIFYLIGQTVLYSLVMYNIVLGVLQKADTQDSFIMYFFGIAIDIIFMALALGAKIREIRKKEELHKKAMQITAQEKSIAISVKNISHQWSVPLVQLGALVTKLEFLVEQKNHFAPEQIALIGKINEVISYMDELTKKYQNMYRYGCEVEKIDIQEMVSKIKLLLKHAMEKIDIRLNINIEQSRSSLVTNENTLMQVLIILIDNATSISEKRKIKNPTIGITYGMEKDKYFISVMDNAGGVKAESIDKVFDYQRSEKDGGLGYGLYLAKHLCEEILKAKISVKNSEQGANFFITFD